MATAPAALSFLSSDTVDQVSKETSSGRYINPAKIEGEKRIRFFGTGITGFEGWTTDNKPVRWESKPDKLPANLKQEDGRDPLRRFIAGVVWDYDNEEFKILQITQKTIMNDLFKFMKDSDYGDPTEYDLKISRKGEGKNTEYSTVPAPPKSITKDMAEAYEALHCNLAALFDGDDPFAEPAA
jgi:hypothetical protein